MAAAGKVEALFKGRQFDQEIIVLCVRWYLRYKLSTRAHDPEGASEMADERKCTRPS
jgi:transposase-like protein